MRLDASTLTVRRYRDLVDALMEIDQLRTQRGRQDVLSQIRSRWRETIAHHDADRPHVMRIWEAADDVDKRTELFAAIELMDPGSSTRGIPLVLQLVAECSAFVAANEVVYPVLGTLVEMLRDAPAPTIARWITQVQSAAGIELDAHVGLAPPSLRDLILSLGNYPARPDGSSFPLFTFVEGVAVDSLQEPALTRLRAILNALAVPRGVTPDGLARLRTDVAPASLPRTRDMRAGAWPPTQDPSILVRIDPDLERRAPPHFFLRVYDWQPWESARVAADMRSSGRALNPSEPTPSITRDRLLSGEPVSAVGQEIGRRLMRSATPLPLVEFLVPAALLGEPFDAVQVDSLGDGQFLVALGTVARVVVRPLERWEPQFLKERQRLVALWQQRWRNAVATAAGPLRAWLWRSTMMWSAVPGVLGTQQYRDVGCVGVAFAPVTQERASQIYGVILAVGAPIALWMRSGEDIAVEQILQRIVDAADPPDLRDRVHGERASAVAAGTIDSAALTLLWDDPDRPPVTVDG